MIDNNIMGRRYRLNYLQISKKLHIHFFFWLNIVLSIIKEYDKIKISDILIKELKRGNRNIMVRVLWKQRTKGGGLSEV